MELATLGQLFEELDRHPDVCAVIHSDYVKVTGSDINLEPVLNLVETE